MRQIKLDKAGPQGLYSAQFISASRADEAEVDAARTFVPGRFDELIAEHRGGADNAQARYTLPMYAYWRRAGLRPSALSP